MKDAQMTTLLRRDLMLIHLCPSGDFFKAPTVVCYDLPPAHIALLFLHYPAHLVGKQVGVCGSGPPLRAWTARQIDCSM